MTSRQLFMKTFEEEKGAFERVFKAVSQKKWKYQPHKNSRTAQAILSLIVYEPGMMVDIVKKGKINDMHSSSVIKSTAEALKIFSKDSAALKKAVMAMSDSDWIKKEAVMKFEGGEWKSKIGDMSWGFLLDMIHHRGQLSTYIRPMGGKVPSIYGPSGDSK